MDSPPEPSQNRKQILPWRLRHPNDFHPDQPHVTLFNLIKFHYRNSNSWKKYFQILDLILLQMSLGIFILPMLIRSMLRFDKQDDVTIPEFLCLTLSGYYKRKFTENGRIDTWF